MQLASLLVLFSIASSAAAPSKQTMAMEPEFEGEVHSWTTGGSLSSLEKASAVPSTKLRGMGLGGVKTAYRIDGPKSPVRYSATQMPLFVVRVANQAADPSVSIDLYEMVADSKRRKIDYSSASVFGVKLQGAASQQRLGFAKFGSNSLKITVLSVRRGEYCFNTGGSAPVAGPQARTVWCFGVD